MVDGWWMDRPATGPAGPAAPGPSVTPGGTRLKNRRALGQLGQLGRPAAARLLILALMKLSCLMSSEIELKIHFLSC